MLKADFVDCSYDEEIGSNAVDAFVLITNVSKNHYFDEIIVPNVVKDQSILDGYSNDKEKYLLKYIQSLLTTNKYMIINKIRRSCINS
jgi:hypothetical protein